MSRGRGGSGVEWSAIPRLRPTLSGTPKVFSRRMVNSFSFQIRHISKNNVWDTNSQIARNNLKMQKKMLKSIVIMCGKIFFLFQKVSQIR